MTHRPSDRHVACSRADAFRPANRLLIFDLIPITAPSAKEGLSVVDLAQYGANIMKMLVALLALLSVPVVAQSAPRTVGPMPDARVYNWIDAQPKKGTHKYDDFTAKDVSRTYTNIGVRIQDASERVTIDGGTWRDAGSPESIGAAFSLVAGSMTIRNVTAIGNWSASAKPKAKFPNRDGIMGAQRTFLTVNGGTFRGFWDAGIDTKATTVMTGTVTAEDNRVSLKVWGPLVGDTLVSINSRDGDVAALKSPVVTGKIHLRKIVVRNSNPNGLLASFQGDGGVIRIDECELHVPASYRVSWVSAGSKNTRLILGPTCAKDGKVVVAPLKPVADAQGAQIVNAGQLLPDGSRDGLIKLGAVWAAKLKLKTNTVVRHLDGFRYEVVR